MTPKKEKILKSKKGEILGILLIVLSLFLAVALLSHDPGDWPGSSREFDEPSNNFTGRYGAFVSYYLFQMLGLTSYAVVLFMITAGLVIFLHKKLRLLISPAFFLCVTGVFLPLLIALGADVGSDNTRVEPAFRYGGILGGLVAHYMVTYLGKTGTLFIALGSILISLVLTTNIKPSAAFEALLALVRPLVHAAAGSFKTLASRKKPPKRKKSLITKELSDEALFEDESPFLTPLEEEALEETMREFSRPAINIREPSIETPDIVDENLSVESEIDEYREKETTEEAEYRSLDQKLGSVPVEYILPGLDLLDETKLDMPAETKEEMLEQAQRIVESLKHFNIEAEVLQITPGPIVTRYEIRLAPGVKVGRVVSLSNDLSMALRARGSIRIIAPIPGKAAIGIEVPNKMRSIVYFRELVESEVFSSADRPLVIALGKNISGDPVIADLAKMPHLLIAGSTGSGKSVSINTIIASILMKASPYDVRMILVDPKVVELNIYNSIPHLLTPVINDIKRSSGALKWAVREMESRYRQLASLGVRDIHHYNEKINEMIEEAAETDSTEDLSVDENDDQQKIPEHLPLIVIIIDEFADLMMIAANEIEESIARLAQMARAVGMHLVLATQRPSADIITGLIKANFPSRIAFKVMQASNSRIILDEGGADKLLGMGDMLFLQAGKPEAVRIHGAYITSDECKRIVEFIAENTKETPEKISEDLFREESGDTDNALGLRDPNERDKLFYEAARLVVRHNQGSVSLLQRRLKIGYARAARLIDQLELAGIVTPYDGSKAREVLVDDMYIDELEAGEMDI